MKLPIRLRLTLWYSALLAGAMLLFSLTVYLVMANALVGNLDTTLKDRIRQVTLETRYQNGHLTLPSHEEQTDIPAIPTVLLSPSGHVQQGRLPPGLAPWLRRHRSDLRSGLNLYRVSDVRAATSSVVYQGRLAGYVLDWQSTRSIDAAQHSLLLVILGIGPCLLLIAAFGGFVLARRALAPVAQITHTASAISATDLSRHVQVGPARDELSELATTFNAMIDRLAAAVERERRFTADASHELRSPLAVIRAEATLALDRPRSAAEYRSALSAVDDQAAAMEELIAALLMLARLETLRELPREVLPVIELVNEAVEQARRSIDQPVVSLDCRIPEDLEIEGSRPLLSRAVRNIVENAIKASPPGGTIRIHAAREGNRVVLAIQDEGPGIDLDRQQRIFEPFYQVAPARTPGHSHGLGLAICRRIIAAHGGVVTVESTPGRGACFRIILPPPADCPA